jgi:hypothetical protein
MSGEGPSARKSILFICGSMNQTTQMHQIALELPKCDRSFTPYYADGAVEKLRRAGLMEFTIIGQRWRRQCLSFIADHGLALDMSGARGPYDLVLTCQDLFIPENVKRSKGILVQEGMTDPENFMFRVVQRYSFVPRYLASTAATGLSNWYDKFCVASDGFADLFIKRGVTPSKLVVTGIPNFDNCERFRDNSFPHRGYVLVCTSDARETFKLHDRKAVISRAVRIAAGRKLIFKLHPNEQFARARREIEALAPGALVYIDGCAEHMVANCDVLVTEYSSTAFVGLALGKEVHSEFPTGELRRLLPLQNGTAARNIARVCRELLRTNVRPQPTRPLGTVNGPTRGAWSFP